MRRARWIAVLIVLCLLATSCVRAPLPRKRKPKPKPPVTEQRKARLVARMPEHTEWRLVNPGQFYEPPKLPDNFPAVPNGYTEAFGLELSARFGYDFDERKIMFDVLDFERHVQAYGFASMIARRAEQHGVLGSLCFFLQDEMIVVIDDLVVRIGLHNDQSLVRAIKLVELLETLSPGEQPHYPGCFPDAGLKPETLHLYPDANVLSEIYEGEEVSWLELGPYADLYAAEYESPGGEFVLFLCEYANPSFAELIFVESLKDAGAGESIAELDESKTVPHFTLLNEDGSKAILFQSENLIGGALGVEDTSIAANAVAKMIGAL